jgi:hypothetical protein
MNWIRFRSRIHNRTSSTRWRSNARSRRTGGKGDPRLRQKVPAQQLRQHRGGDVVALPPG